MEIYFQDELTTLYLGDSREVLPTLAEKFTAIITDPVWPNCPEGLLTGWENPDGLFSECARYFPQLAKRVCIVLGCNSDPRFLVGMPKEMPFIRTAKLEYVHPSYQGRILNAFDVAYVFGETPTVSESSQLLPGRCIDTAPIRKLEWHPCPRKRYHMEWLIQWYARRGSVLDPFAGSGTTLLAARKFGLRNVGIEIEESYCEGIVMEIQEMKRKPTLFYV